MTIITASRAAGTVGRGGGLGEATVPLAFTLFVGKGKGAKLRFKYKEYKTQKAGDQAGKLIRLIFDNVLQFP